MKDFGIPDTDTIAVGTDPQWVAVNEAANRAYVPNMGAGTVSVIDTTTDKVVETITAGMLPARIVVLP